MEFATIHKVAHYVFDDEKEFKNHCINSNINPIPPIVTNWREAEELDWVLSDDDRIVQILRVGYFTKQGKKSRYVRTIVGTFHTEHITKMDTDFGQHLNRYTLSKTIKIPNENLGKRISPTSKEQIWAAEIVLLGKKPWEAYKEVFDNMHPDNCRKLSAYLLKQERIIKYMSKLVTEAADGLGLNHEWVLTKYKAIADEAKSENTRLTAVDRIAEVIGTTGEVKTETTQIAAFTGFGNADAELVGEATVIKELSE